MNQNAALMIRWCLILFLDLTSVISIISCGSPYPESDGIYVYHSSGCDTLKLDVLKKKQNQFRTEINIKTLSGFSFYEIDSIIIKSPTAETDSISVLKLKHEKGEFIRGAGRMTKWKPETWKSEKEIPVYAENIPGETHFLRIVFKEKLSPGVYAICVRRYYSGIPETFYYDFKIK